MHHVAVCIIAASEIHCTYTKKVVKRQKPNCIRFPPVTSTEHRLFGGLNDVLRSLDDEWRSLHRLYQLEKFRSKANILI